MNETSDLKAYLTGHWLTDLANFSAFVFHALPDLNWAGFYLDHGDKLRLGPFVGKPACTEIAYGRGVCGSAYSNKETLLVADVHAFPGHIACDSASRSEMVIPFMINEVCVGVFDLDSPTPGRFTERDRAILEQWLKVLAQGLHLQAGKAKPWRE